MSEKGPVLHVQNSPHFFLVDLNFETTLMLIFALTSYPMTSSGVLLSHWSKHHCVSGNSYTLGMVENESNFHTFFNFYNFNYNTGGLFTNSA